MTVMEILELLFGKIGDFTWGWALVPMLVIFGVFFTISSGFAQLRYFKRMFRVFDPKIKPEDPNAISGREALLLSIGGRVGGGNIAGVAVAITLGGPGAVFWMWTIAFIGMATSMVECTIAQVYKHTDSDGNYRGGAARSIIYGLGERYRWLAVIYSICLCLSFAIGFNAFQGNTVAGAIQNTFVSLGFDNSWHLASFMFGGETYLISFREIAGISLAIIAGTIIFGGIKRIAKASDIVVPVMALVYIGLAILVIVTNITEVPGVIASIVKNALGFEEVVSGGVGAAIAQGMKRGLFSNEAGLGSVPNVAAVAKVKHPVSQGITQSLSVFIDTMIVCSCTAFMILLSDVYQPGAEIDGIKLTQDALASHFGNWAQYFLTIAIVLFSFSTIIYNYYLGENALSFITKNRGAILLLRFVVIGIVVLGAVAPQATSVFFFSDPLMGVLALVNLVALLMLFPIFIRVLDDFKAQLKSGIERPVFHADNFSDLDIDKSAWDK